jgi:hypothetical protein
MVDRLSVCGVGRSPKKRLMGMCVTSAGFRLTIQEKFTFGSPNMGTLCSFKCGPWGGATLASGTTKYMLSLEFVITIPEVASPSFKWPPLTDHRI